jgi:hypothetical protein
LSESSATWNARLENRFLPSWWEHLTIHLLTDRRKWTEPQRKMMGKAGRVHGFRSVLVFGCLVLLASAGVVRNQAARRQEATRIEGLVGRLVNAERDQLPDIVKELDANPELADTYLSPLLSKPAGTLGEQRVQLHARLAAVARDPSLVEPLVEELLGGKVTYVMPIRQRLRPPAATLANRFRIVLRNERDPERRFRAALALADYVPRSESNSWRKQDLKFVAEQLVSSNAEFQPLLREALRPIREELLADLERTFADSKATDAQRLGAANAFADYSATDVGKLSRLLAVAAPEQFAVLYPLVAASPAPSTVEDLGRMAATLPPDDLGSAERVPFGQRRANAASHPAETGPPRERAARVRHDRRS